MRISDATRLQWENVSLPFSTIRFRQVKTRKEALTRIPTAYKERLQNLYRKGATGLVYANTEGHRVLYTHLDKAFRSVLKACGISKKSPIHCFRHTAAMRLLSAGVPVHEVANQLGDTVETVVRSYVKPAVPSLECIDQAYNEVTRKRHANVEEMKGTAAYAVSEAMSPKQKNLILKDTLG